MPKTVDTGGEPERTDADARKVSEKDSGAGQSDVKEKSAPVDEDGPPLSVDDEGNGHQHFRARPVYKRPAFLIGAIIVLLVVAIFGIRYWLYARSHETTDDAFVDGHIIQVSAKASGYVARVYVNDNQQVNAGDLLAS